MVDSFTSFLSQYSEFNRTIQEYVTTYQYALAQQNAKANSDRTSLLSELQVIENEDRRQKIQLQNRVAEQLNTLHRLLYTVDQHERGITEKRFRKYKDGYEEGPQVSDDHYTQREINSQVTTAIKSIEKITKSRMPKIRRAARCPRFGATAARTHARYALRCNGSAQAREPKYASSDSGT